jgi:7-keto-8-aminopelargonate synthetase-like enzyme
LGDTQILPVVVGDRTDALALADAVRDRGVVAPAIRPPTVPEGESRVRVVPMASHDRVDLEDCIHAFRTAGEEVGVI